MIFRLVVLVRVLVTIYMDVIKVLDCGSYWGMEYTVNLEPLVLLFLRG